MIHGSEGRLRATRFGTTKIPDPMMVPTTMAAESSSPNLRGSSPAGCMSAHDGTPGSQSRGQTRGAEIRKLLGSVRQGERADDGLHRAAAGFRHPADGRRVVDCSGMSGWGAVWPHANQIPARGAACRPYTFSGTTNGLRYSRVIILLASASPVI